MRALGPMLHACSQDEGGCLPVWKHGDTYWWEMIADPDEFDPERYEGSVAALMLDGSERIMNANTEFESDSKWFEVMKL